MKLDKADLEHWEIFKTLPRGVEERLGMDPKRTGIIVETVMELPSDWQIMLYCPSVAGAEFIAAHLSLAGVNAQSISAHTPWDARRKAIKDYNNGDIRILTNYTVLAEGFDAPVTRGIVISRPVFSPNLYQQIVGRGLRGPLNGGKEQCTIIDVADNYEQFGGQLAFTHFEYLWAD